MSTKTYFMSSPKSNQFIKLTRLEFYNNNTMSNVVDIMEQSSANKLPLWLEELTK